MDVGGTPTAPAGGVGGLLDWLDLKLHGYTLLHSAPDWLYVAPPDT